MTCNNLQTEAFCISSDLTDFFQFKTLFITLFQGVQPGVQLHKISASLRSKVDRFSVGLNKEAYLNSRRFEWFQKFHQACKVTNNIKPPFRGEFLPFFRYQGNKLRLGVQGYLLQLRGHGHLKVQLCGNCLAESCQIIILDVAAVFAQVADNACSS